MNLKDKPFALLGVNVNGYIPAKLKAAMEKEKMNWRSFADPNSVGQGALATKWNVADTPTFYLIDHQGLIRYKWVGSPSERAIDAALAKLISEADESVRRTPD